MKKLVACAIALVSVLALLTSAGAATTTKAIKDMGVVLIINTNLGDKSFCDLSNEGILAAAKEFGFRTKVVELGGDTTRQIPTLTEFAESKDWDLIVCGTYNIRESFQTVAQQFPNKKFILYDAKDDKSLPNVYSVEHLQNEGSFVAGAAAAMLTSSKAPLANSKKIIGFVAGGENTSINDFLVGYIQGALSVDPAIKVLISYIGNFKDTAKAKEMAIAQINQGADVVFQVAGGAGLGVLDACKDKNVYAIGVDSDQAMVLEPTRPDLSKIICTSMQKKVNKTVYNAIKGALDGTLPWGKYETVGLKQGSIGIAKNKYFDAIFTADQKKQLEDLEAKVASGKIKVQTAIGMDNDTINKIRDSVRP